MKKVCRLTGTRNILQNEVRFKDVAQQIGGIQIDFICYLDYFFDIDGTFKNIHTGKVLADYDYFWIWGIKGIAFKSSLIYYYIHLLNKKLIDERVKYMIDNSKLSQIVLLKHLHIPTPKSMFFILDRENKEQLQSVILERFSYPFILKNPTLDRWEGVFLIHNQEELVNYLDDPNFPCYLIQEFIENDGDYRVLSTREWVIGMIKRVNEKDFRNNISTGGSSMKVEQIPSKIHQITKTILDYYKLDIAWIDFFIKDNECFVIEINDLPQYGGFEQVSDISYPKAVLSYIKNL